jgi:hypothetical protein
MSEPTFHAGSKLAWIEQIAIDRNSAPFHLRVAVAISRRVKGAGDAHVSQETIANMIGATVRGVRKAIVALQQRGHIEVAAAGLGRGKATLYRPIIKRRNGCSGFLGDSTPKTRNEGTRNSEAQKAEHGSTKSGTAVPPKIPYKNPIQNPGARASAGETSHGFDPLALRWQAIKEELARVETFGPAKVEAWLDNIRADRIDEGTVVLMAPSKFIANYVTARFSEQIVAQWHKRDASIVRLQVVATLATVTKTGEGERASEAASPIAAK